MLQKKPELNQKILSMLANQLGIESDDITTDDSFAQDLHMSSIDLADFAHTLEDTGFAITPEDISKFATVGELTEFLTMDDGV
ncbi:hypothetical protein A2125_01760 [Candidatus Woesebacteria bacterium GWB1_43_5]|uniref:Carrier domain-containing protein n=1 Tax=Candidatus Woesebacteria bacterium GWB1_43_5 TaxID=1802474 RepID=A0A1F7WRY2_9BACT|nr:MAG: hypothetical protein A2125_01760 [Candidatus Woesebacteria bacterium GWB1_43_5]